MSTAGGGRACRGARGGTRGTTQYLLLSCAVNRKLLQKVKSSLKPFGQERVPCVEEPKGAHLRWQTGSKAGGGHRPVSREVRVRSLNFTLRAPGAADKCIIPDQTRLVTAHAAWHEENVWRTRRPSPEAADGGLVESGSIRRVWV